VVVKKHRANGVYEIGGIRYRQSAIGHALTETTMMDYARVVESLIGEYDLSNETGRKKAYQRCEEYAERHLQARLEFNAFMAVVAERLGMAPMRRNDFRDSVGEVPEGAKLYLTYAPKVGPELTGNADGLRHLAALLAELAEQAVEHDHVHLDPGVVPMYGRTYPLTIYHEPDTWFGSLEEKESKEGPGEPDLAVRDIQPFEIAALCLLANVPPEMLLTKHRLYRVLFVDAGKEEGVWKKCIRASRERLFLFTLVNDDGAPQHFGFDLDDPEVLFFTRQDIARLTAGEPDETKT
jgi:hypothetical protein